MAKRGETDWQEVERRYVEGGDDVTFKSLAKDFGCSVSPVNRRAATGKWTDKRGNFRAIVGQAEQAKTVEREAERRSLAAIARVSKLEELFLHCAEEIVCADPGFNLQAAAVDLGIICDKLHKELDRAPSAANMTDAAWLCLVQQAQRGDVAAAKEILARTEGTVEDKIVLRVVTFGEDDRGGGNREAS